MMVAIRRTKAKEEFGGDPSLDLPQGARNFLPRVQEETGNLWTPKVSLELRDARREPRGEVEG